MQEKSPGAASAPADNSSVDEINNIPSTTESDTSHHNPAVRKLLTEHNIDGSEIKGTGKGGRLTLRM